MIGTFLTVLISVIIADLSIKAVSLTISDMKESRQARKERQAVVYVVYEEHLAYPTDMAEFLYDVAATEEKAERIKVHRQSEVVGCAIHVGVRWYRLKDFNKIKEDENNG